MENVIANVEDIIIPSEIFSLLHVSPGEYKTRKPICRRERRATAYTVPVVVLTFKFIQGRCFRLI